jgi:hypothetical protein
MRGFAVLALLGGISSVSARISKVELLPHVNRRIQSIRGNDLAARGEQPKTNLVRGPTKDDPANDPRFSVFSCGTTEFGTASQDLIEAHKALFHEHNSVSGTRLARLRARALQARNEAIEIEVAIHIVTTKEKENSIAKDVPEKQLATLNKAYKDTGFSFKLLDTTWTANDAWAIGATEDDIMAMKKELRKGKYATLNLYFMSDLAGSILGVCSMPSEISDPKKPKKQADLSVYVDDGCTINAGTLPGGSVYGYDQGMTAAHETGHWLGLFHVFEGYSCEGDGDLIADTAPQSVSTDGCPAAKDVQHSCPGKTWKESELVALGATLPPGVKDGDAMVDNVHNVMDYSTDACYTGFTPMQVQRMKELWKLYRGDR